MFRFRSLLRNTAVEEIAAAATSTAASATNGAAASAAAATPKQKEPLTKEKLVERAFKTFGLPTLDQTPHRSSCIAGHWQIVKDTEVRKAIDPATGNAVSHYEYATTGAAVGRARRATEKYRDAWQAIPAPKRGLIVQEIGQELRKHKADIATIISLEMGKIYQEALGEVQEAIDICDFAVGLSRQIGGSVFPSERKDHFMKEQWLPHTGDVGIITAFNFPVAVFFWNAALSLICGNTQLFKPAPSGSLSGIVVTKVINRVLARHGHAGIAATIIGNERVGQAITRANTTSLVSFTGSTQVGRAVGVDVARRFGKCILELGGNNAALVMPDANLDMVVRSALFGAVGTAGQRCTSLRRLIIHEDVYDDVRDALVEAYKSVPIGDPFDKTTLCGPVHNEAAVQKYKTTVDRIKSGEAKLIYGGEVIDRPGYFVTPTIAEAEPTSALTREEAFVPILYLMKAKSYEHAVRINNQGSHHGLSSAIFTNNVATALAFTSAATGSDCGIANVNIGTSGAEIGGAFGGEKETGGGRESGSDAWKAYMRRQTNTINFGSELPLAQGIVFDVKITGKGNSVSLPYYFKGKERYPGLEPVAEKKPAAEDVADGEAEAASNGSGEESTSTAAPTSA